MAAIVEEGKSAYQRAMTKKYGHEKWDEMETKAINLQRRLTGIEGRLTRASSSEVERFYGLFWKPCTTDIYICFVCAHYGYVRRHKRMECLLVCSTSLLLARVSRPSIPVSRRCKLKLPLSPFRPTSHVHTSSSWLSGTRSCLPYYGRVSI